MESFLLLKEVLVNTVPNGADYAFKLIFAARSLGQGYRGQHGRQTKTSSQSPMWIEDLCQHV